MEQHKKGIAIAFLVILVLIAMLGIIRGLQEKVVQHTISDAVCMTQESAEEKIWDGQINHLDICDIMVVTLADEPEAGFFWKEGIISIKNRIAIRSDCLDAWNTCAMNYFACGFSNQTSWESTGGCWKPDFYGLCICTLDDYKLVDGWYVKDNGGD